MGYSCPVCGDPQADDVHLANHLAFTALVRGGDHEAWLDDHVPDWESRDQDGLAGAVTDLAESAEYPQVFEDTTGDDHRHEHAPTDSVPVDVAPVEGSASDEEIEEILAEAREMTQKRRGHSGEGSDDPAADDSAGDDQRTDDLDGNK
jgi:hypothetical protein